MHSGIFVVLALVEFGVIVWLLLRRRDDRRKITDLTLRARRAELRESSTYPLRPAIVRGPTRQPKEMK